jgi:GMP synthase (glutamine-hydrolysing)
MLDTFKKATPEALAAIKVEMKVRRTKEVFLLFAMGSQTEPPPFDSTIFDLGIAVFGICLGFQMGAKHFGADVQPGARKEFGAHRVVQVTPSILFDGLPNDFQALQSHGDEVRIGSHLNAFAISDGIVAAASHEHFHGVQFHPEVSDTPDGPQIFENFCFKICEAKDRFPSEDVAQKKIAQIKERIGNKKVLLALSGGSDSSVLAHLLKHATSGREQLVGVYIKGIDRPDDEAFVHKYFGNQDWIQVVVVDATDKFLSALVGTHTMRNKRMAMRSVYKPVLEEMALKYSASFIAQGTLYTDISESGGGHGSSARKAVIKVHHNTNLGFSLPELTPLDDQVKDNARDIGRAIGVPEELLTRHPFPGPGLVVRIEGEITAEKLSMARKIDGIYIEELRRAGLYESTWQAGAVVTQSLHTYTKGDDAGSGPVIMLWAVWSVDGFTAQAAELPHDFLKHVSRRIGNEVPGVGAVVYRISDKPFSTIEAG